MDDVTRVLEELAHRLHRNGTLRAAMRSYRSTSMFAAAVPWTPAGWGFGAAGLAMVCAEVYRAGGGDVWVEHARDHLRRGAAAWTSDPGLGLFDGATGFGFVTATLAAQGWHTTAATQLAERLAPAIAQAAAGSDAETVDLMSGVAGHGIYLLSVADDGHRDAMVAVRDACDRALRLSPRTGAPALEIPVPAEAGFAPGVATSLSCGMAHGVAGLIAVRARLAEADGEAGASLDTLRAATCWLIAQRTAGTLLWPRAVLFDRSGRTCGQVPASSMGWWCTGSAGIARALWLAGTAIAAAEPCELAVDVMAQLAADRSSWPSTAGLCHGLAGLLVIAQEFARDTGRADISELAGSLVDVLVARFDETSVLGFRNVEPPGRHVDDPGLVCGTTGVALGLAAAALFPGRPGWVRTLGI